MATFSEPLSIRISPQLDRLLDAEARRLGVRRSDVVRIKLAEALTGPQNTVPQDVVGGASCQPLDFVV